MTDFNQYRGYKDYDENADDTHAYHMKFLDIAQCNELVSLGIDMSDARHCWLNSSFDKEVYIDDRRNYENKLCTSIENYGRFICFTYTLEDIVWKIQDIDFGSEAIVSFKRCDNGVKCMLTVGDVLRYDTFGDDNLNAAYDVLRLCMICKTAPSESIYKVIIRGCEEIGGEVTFEYPVSTSTISTSFNGIYGMGGSSGRLVFGRFSEDCVDKDVISKVKEMKEDKAEQKASPRIKELKFVRKDKVEDSVNEATFYNLSVEHMSDSIMVMRFEHTSLYRNEK